MKLNELKQTEYHLEEGEVGKIVMRLAAAAAILTAGHVLPSIEGNMLRKEVSQLSSDERQKANKALADYEKSYQELQKNRYDKETKKEHREKVNALVAVIKDIEKSKK